MFVILLNLSNLKTTEGWNTPKYSLNRWPSLEVHHWATTLRFFTNIWFLHTLNICMCSVGTVCQCFDPIIRWNESETKANLETMSASLTRTQRDQVRWKRQCLSLIGHLFYSSVKSCTSFIVCHQGPTGRVFQCRAGSGIGKNNG